MGYTNNSYYCTNIEQTILVPLNDTLNRLSQLKNLKLQKKQFNCDISNTLLLFTINDLNHLLASEVSKRKEKKSIQIMITENGNNSYQQVFLLVGMMLKLCLFHPVFWTIIHKPLNRWGTFKRKVIPFGSL